MSECYFTEQHELIRKLAKDFAERELTKELLDEVEETGVFPEEVLQKMAKAGFFGGRCHARTRSRQAAKTRTCWGCR